jgi:hypothetical protein
MERDERETVRDPAVPARPVPERDVRPGERAEPETARRPVPGVKHEPEPDAGNIMPAENEPGTL